MLLRQVEVDGRRRDVRVRDGRVTEVGGDLATDDAEVIDGDGGALLPGLHDHHLHLMALAAARTSVDCSSRAGLESLATARGTWARGVNYHESVAGPLDRHALDRLVGTRPARVQHRTGALWIFNTAGLQQLRSPLDQSADVERDADGVPTGRLWRYDARLSGSLDREPPDLTGTVAELVSWGITGVTDATPDLDAQTTRLLTDLPLAVTVLGRPDGSEPSKVLLRDHDLPSFSELRSVVDAVHSAGRPVAVHCVTRTSLILTLGVLEESGTVPGDRIEHASVVPPGVATWMRRLGVRVVTQPAFISVRGDDYLDDVAPDDLACLYPYASLLADGVATVASSDAPYGPADPWAVIRAARDRLTPSGVVLGADERVPAATVLAGYLTDAHGAPRAVAPGHPADLCLLRLPLADALRHPSAELVRMTLVAGEPHAPR